MGHYHHYLSMSVYFAHGICLLPDHAANNAGKRGILNMNKSAEIGLKGSIELELGSFYGLLYSEWNGIGFRMTSDSIICYKMHCQSTKTMYENTPCCH